MKIEDKNQQLIEIEERYLSDVLTILKKQNISDSNKFDIERRKARELTSELVNARQAEDKQLIASDEAVAHALSHKKAKDLDITENMLDSPYFARLILKEEVNGKIVEREYKLGKFANADCRIIDWRKAPIAKIYYEYKEGEEFFEEVQGQDREGTVDKKVIVNIKKSVLKSFSCKEGRFLKVDGKWEYGNKNEKTKTDNGQLPDVLSLISSEQFNLITQNVNTAILLQGVAGSGKTTVALHRLSWLIAQNDLNCNPANCIIIAESPALRKYIQNSLEALELSEVKVTNFSEFALPLLRTLGSDFFYDDQTIKRPNKKCPQSVSRFINSLAVLDYLESENFKVENVNPFLVLVELCKNANKLIELDKTRLIDKELINDSFEVISNFYNEKVIDQNLESILIKVIQIQSKNNKKFDHILIDEVQEASPVKLACFLSSVSSASKLTLVGDTAQAFENEKSFPGWDALKSRWENKESETEYISLKISHRSTLPIMKLADFVQDRKIVTEGRKGRVPIHFIQNSEESAVKAAIDWLSIALERYPNQLTLVICANNHEAKELESFLKPNFGSQVRLETSNNFSFDAGIIISTVRYVRGLEFTNVLIWNVSKQNYPNNPMTRNALYVAITRAEENLCLINYGKPSLLLPSGRVKLTRVNVEEEE